jgi:hypothetical protein
MANLTSTNMHSRRGRISEFGSILGKNILKNI